MNNRRPQRNQSKSMCERLSTIGMSHREEVELRRALLESMKDAKCTVPSKSCPSRHSISSTASSETTSTQHTDTPCDRPKRQTRGQPRKELEILAPEEERALRLAITLSRQKQHSAVAPPPPPESSISQSMTDQLSSSLSITDQSHCPTTPTPAVMATVQQPIISERSRRAYLAWKTRRRNKALQLHHPTAAALSRKRECSTKLSGKSSTAIQWMKTSTKSTTAATSLAWSARRKLHLHHPARKRSKSALLMTSLETHVNPLPIVSTTLFVDYLCHYGLKSSNKVFTSVANVQAGENASSA